MSTSQVSCLQHVPDPYDGSTEGGTAISAPSDERLTGLPDSDVGTERSTVFVFHTGRTFPVLEEWASRHKPSFFARKILAVASYLEYQRNPRSRSYMETLVACVFPKEQSKIVEVSGQGIPVDWQRIDRIVLLWPDGNGTGWSAIEREVFRKKQATAKVLVLNGRRRLFQLERGRWRAIQCRRVLEKTLLLEMTLFCVFLVTGSALALWDSLRGGGDNVDDKGHS
jgi:hypothetical protein